MRYLLETCDTVSDARAVLERVPVHAPQNLSLLDRGGEHVTAYVGPGRQVRFVDTPVTTNHQGTVEWPEYARAIRTEERERCLLDLLDDGDISRDGLLQRFLEPPLHNRRYAEGFGTIYTAAYDPAAGSVQYLWPDHEPWELSLGAFSPGSRTVKLVSS
jgi:predicted choloylglycine hydrolase